MSLPQASDLAGRRVVVGLSGGVDSAVAALLLQRLGCRVEGLFMKNWEEDDHAGYCAAATDIEDARRITERLDIPLHLVNFATEYWERVFGAFLSEYAAGRTPNPDVWCNREIKFRAFLDHALGLGADAIATGHYAGLGLDDGGTHLLRARDEEKDQTYFLFALGQDQLSRSLFPLFQLTKFQVREIAREAGFPNAEKKDSTGICFIGERKFRDFLQSYLPAQPGPMQTPEGCHLGTHQGLMYYTLGQRQGLGIGGIADTPEQPWYVVAKDIPTNRLIVAQGHEHPLLYHSALETGPMHWIAGHPPTEGAFACLARTRHRQPLQPCRVEVGEQGQARIHFLQAQRAITPGQAAVLYLDRECLGGGLIERPLNCLAEQ